jgi:hypothetical protein
VSIISKNPQLKLKFIKIEKKMIEKEQISEINGTWDATNTLFTGSCEINYSNSESYKGDVD